MDPNALLHSLEELILRNKVLQEDKSPQGKCKSLCTMTDASRLESQENEEMLDRA